MRAAVKPPVNPSSHARPEGTYRPLRTGLFFYECVRIVLLAVCLYLAPPEASGADGFIPYPVYLSSNALFPLMALFIWLRPAEYRSYLTLYLAGKIIAVILFFLWEIFTVRQVPLQFDLLRILFIMGSGILISLADTLSVWGLWMLRKKYRQAPEGCLENGGT